MEQAKIINRRLAEYFGPAPNSDNLPLFRIVWSEGLTEKRHGAFDKHCGNIYLGTEITTKEAKKYSWVKERWILEVYSGSSLLASEVIKLGDNYEPVWIFEKDGEYQPLWWPAIEHLCKQWIESTTKGFHQRKNDKILTEEEEKEHLKARLEIEESLDLTPLQLAFRRGVGEAILLPGKEIDWKGVK